MTLPGRSLCTARPFSLRKPKVVSALAPSRGPSRASPSKEPQRVPSPPLTWRRASVFAFTTPQKNKPKQNKKVLEGRQHKHNATVALNNF